MRTFSFFITLTLLSSWTTAKAAETLSNEKLLVEFGDRGLISIYDQQTDRTLSFADDEWSFIIDQTLVDSSELMPTSLAKKNEPPRYASRKGNTVRYSFRESPFTIEVVYELKPGWRFITKQLFISNKRNDVYTVRHVDVCQGQLKGEQPTDIHLAGLAEKVKRARHLGDYAAFLRFDGEWGAMFMMQNPYMDWEYKAGQFSMDYRLDMTWAEEYGPFASDRACIGIYDQTGVMGPAGLQHRESWLLEPVWAQDDRQFDMGEVEAGIACVRNFLLYKPEKSVRIHVPWCENDYQINIASRDGQAQFQRIIDTCASLDVGHVLYTVRNDDVALKKDDADAWGWEHLLWLNQGIQIRKGEWDPKKDELPKLTQEMIDYAASKDIKLMAYVYPSLPFMQNPDWLTLKNAKRNQLVANVGFRSFQDWFIDNLIAFKDRTGISGYAFDYWGMKLLGMSPYSQWYGTRRILEELRKRAPDIVIDGRQQYHGYGPWTWLAGSYPHPTGGDEQPESFEAFPDLHFDRSSATQQRLTTYWFRNIQFCPTEIMPGFITHQTARKDAAGELIENEDFNIRDWDYLGWKFSLISSVATAPFAHCVDMIPARDAREFELFAKDIESQQFMTDWFDWTDENVDILRNLRSIIGPPAMGHVDGTAAIDGDHGFLFLFNPNHRRIEAKFRLDSSIGLTCGNEFVLQQLYPEKAKYVGAPRTGVFTHGEEFSMAMDGTTAWVLEIRPAEQVTLPVLFNAPGSATLKEKQLILSEVQGEIGTSVKLEVLLPRQQVIEKVTVNGQQLSFDQNGQVVSIPCSFAGDYFAHNQAVTRYDPSFQGTRVRGEFTIPERIFDQLEQRKKNWPIDWTEEDLTCTWLAPERLLLYIQVAEPDWQQDVSMKLNGEPVEVKKAYSSRTPGRLQFDKGHNTFTGYYVDLSDAISGTKHEMELTLPALKPGQFQGVFFENVETEYTNQIFTDQ